MINRASMGESSPPGLGSLKVLIAGGSIGGLATAVALKAQGHHVTVRYPSAEAMVEPVSDAEQQVFEQALIPDTIGAGITIFPNSLRALEALGIDTNQIKSVRIKKVSKNTEGAFKG